MLSNEEIGLRISSTREMRGLTLDDIATAVGVARSTIQRYEKGSIVKIKLPVLQSIASALCVNPNWLIGNTEDPTPTAAPLLPAAALSWDQQELLDNYDQLNPEGRDALRKHARVMVLSGEYVQHEKPVLASGS